MFLGQGQAKHVVLGLVPAAHDIKTKPSAGHLVDGGELLGGDQRMAERRVRLSLLMSEIISENQVQVDATRVSEKVDELCQPYPNADEMRNLYMQNQQLLSQIQNMVLEEQVTDFLESHAKVGTKKLKFKELMELQAG